jgi:hypothetical protein
MLDQRKYDRREARSKGPIGRGASAVPVPPSVSILKRKSGETRIARRASAVASSKEAASFRALAKRRRRGAVSLDVTGRL